MSPASEAQKRAIAKWQKDNTKVITVRLQCKGDKDILDYLEGKSSAGEFKKALRYYMAHHVEEGNE